MNAFLLFKDVRILLQPLLCGRLLEEKSLGNNSAFALNGKNSVCATRAAWKACQC